MAAILSVWMGIKSIDAIAGIDDHWINGIKWYKCINQYFYNLIYLISVFQNGCHVDN